MLSIWQLVRVAHVGICRLHRCLFHCDLLFLGFQDALDAPLPDMPAVADMDMAEAGGGGDYDAEEGDDDTEESSDDGDADVDDESPAAPPQPQQPPRSIMKTIFGRLLGRRADEVTQLINPAESPELTHQYMKRLLPRRFIAVTVVGRLTESHLIAFHMFAFTWALLILEWEGSWQSCDA